MTKRIQDLASDDEVVQDKASLPIKIRGTANERKLKVKRKIKQLTKDLKSIKQLQERRKRYLSDIIPYIKNHLYQIYRVDNEQLTYNQLKNEYLKDLFPDDATAIIF
ncbi:hypothetical protein PS15p_204777 [Mucor circinelloides]